MKKKINVVIDYPPNHSWGNISYRPRPKFSWLESLSTLLAMIALVFICFQIQDNKYAIIAVAACLALRVIKSLVEKTTDWEFLYIIITVFLLLGLIIL